MLVNPRRSLIMIVTVRRSPPSSRADGFSISEFITSVER